MWGSRLERTEATRVCHTKYMHTPHMYVIALPNKLSLYSIEWRITLHITFQDIGQAQAGNSLVWVASARVSLSLL